MSFGDGSDGDAVISVNTTLTRDMNYNNLTVDAGVTLYPDGYVIYVYDTLTVNGSITRNGHGGGGSVSGPQWPYPGGAALPTRSIGGSGKGGNPGDDGENVIGIAGSSGGSGSNTYSVWYTIGTGGITSSYINITSDNLNEIITNASFRLGGPGGGGSGDYNGNNVAGGGSGGGVVYCSAKNMIVNLGGSVLARGGNGGDSYRGGGGGGGGGCIIIEYATIINNGTIDVSGGRGGIGQFSGSAGTSGTIYSFECVVPVPDVLDVLDTFTLGRFGKKRRHRIEV